MVDILTYRICIGLFNQKFSQCIKNGSKNRMEEYIPFKEKPKSPWMLQYLKYGSVLLFMIMIFSSVMYSGYCNNSKLKILVLQEVKNPTLVAYNISPNLYARMTYGNKVFQGSGLKNMHLNIRTLRNKMTDIKKT